MCGHCRVHHLREEENPNTIWVVYTGSLASCTIVLSRISGLHYNWVALTARELYYMYARHT